MSPAERQASVRLSDRQLRGGEISRGKVTAGSGSLGHIQRERSICD
jgi:hypothetical protein